MLLCLIALAGLCASLAFLEKWEQQPIYLLPMGIGLLFLGGAVLLMLKKLSKLTDYEYEIEEKKIKKRGMDYLYAEADIPTVKKMFINNRFKQTEDFYIKNKLSFSNDLKRYIVCIEESYKVEKSFKPIKF